MPFHSLNRIFAGMNEKPCKKGELRPVMFAGTGSDVGKSLIAAAFCRIFRQDGYQPAPFKAQNMALNSYATPEGYEIGRAQAVQAEAAGIPPHTDMNPILLKPQSDHTSQIVLNGKPFGTQKAYDYFRKEGREELREQVHRAYDRLAKRYSPIVLEGAGSISEMNLRETDLVNMPMARYADASVFLVADIDRGGVFASVYGSIFLQTPEDRERIKGIIINKFRGDLCLFEEGKRLLESLTGVPVLGVVPYVDDIVIDEEDSVALASKKKTAVAGKTNIAVLLLKHLSNFTDFSRLEHDTRVHLFYTDDVQEIEKADVIIVPGSKTVVADLCELRRNGCAQAVVRAHERGAKILGICGGYQMMGQRIKDPYHTESDVEMMPGLGLLPIETTMTKEKITRQVRFQGVWDNVSADLLNGYEIHMGETVFTEQGASPMNHICTEDGMLAEGCMATATCMGTYIHGILDNAAFIDYLIGKGGDAGSNAWDEDYQTLRNRQYDCLADHVRQHVDMERVYEILQGKNR